MAQFVQIVEYSTTRVGEVLAAGEKFRAVRQAADDGPGPISVTVTADRDTPGRYLTMVVFASYEDAMASSDRADTTEFSRQMAELCDGPPVFRNLDVVATM